MIPDPLFVLAMLLCALAAGWFLCRATYAYGTQTEDWRTYLTWFSLAVMNVIALAFCRGVFR